MDKQTFTINEALVKLKEQAKEKFDSSIEVHFNLGIDAKKGDQQIRGSISLPHGSGKSVRVAAFAEGDDLKQAKEAGADLAGGEDLIAEIGKSGKLDFDVAVAHPTIMSQLAKIAKILGPKGLMPSPKDETVTPNVAKTVKELKNGKISFKNDDTGNLHTVIGKKSFTDDQLAENFNALIEKIMKSKPLGVKGEYIKAVYINSTMSPSFKINL
jgi:large subunit ribosomal protein L1